MSFIAFKKAVAKQFAVMSAGQLFRTNVERDVLWDAYLAAFPEGSNPIYRKSTEHDCSCCRQFIKAVGNVVAIKDGALVSIWDVNIPGEPEYQKVADRMSALVRTAQIGDLFLIDTKAVGVDRNFEELIGGQQQSWEHFFVNVPAHHVKPKGSIPTLLGEFRSKREVFHRGLTEITIDSLETILELIDQNSLYRGAEHRPAVVNALKQHREWKGDVLYTWLNVPTIPFRNTVIGTLAVDLSEGVELSRAVASFEAKVAPANYKRPTALATKGMIDQAKKTIEELGLASALQRRYATLNDITVNNILFANRDARKAITGDVFDKLAGSVSKNLKAFDKVEEVPIEKFLSDVLPKAKSLEVLLENRHASRLVSLVAPVDPTAPGLFKWSNGFSWSYTGNMTDSIKERVKAAGGNVTGDLCCRLAWDYTDDLDFHMYEPSDAHIFFGNRNRTSYSGGKLDVDANGGDGMRDNPVENIFYKDRKTMREGVYTLKVHNFTRRSADGTGFEVEIEFDGQKHNIVYDKTVRTGEYVEVAKITYTKAGGFSVASQLPSSTASKTFWGMQSNVFQKVNVLMMSPNHWDGQVGLGNKHYFFMLDGCKNEDTARGFYNEFLKPELDKHRKVLEMVGSKMKTDESSNQLSGLGFSSTQHDSLICRVEGTFNRVIKIVF